VNFGDRLRAARIDAGITQAAMAEVVGVSQSVYAQYETSAKSPNIYIAAKIAKVLGLTLDDLLNGV
jgi:transcriptional regulator with XRE-family HTH domain